MKINLLPKEERPLKQSDVRWEFLVGLLGFIILGAVLVFTWLESTNVDQLKQTYAEALQREDILQQQVQDINSLRNNLNDLKVQVDAYQDVVVDIEQTLTSMPVLTNHVAPQLWISTITWLNQVVELSGYTKDMSSLSQYLYYLNEHSGETNLNSVYPSEEADFLIFNIDVKGVAENGAT